VLRVERNGAAGGEEGELPKLEPVEAEGERLTLAPLSLNFFVFPDLHLEACQGG